MLFRGLGVNPAKSKIGTFRRRASARFAVVRLERLEDRFLLSAGSTAWVSDLRATPDLSSSAVTDVSSRAPGPVLPAIQQANAATGATEDGAQNGVSNAAAGLSTSDQTQPGATSPTDNPQSGSGMGASEATGATEQNGSPPLDSGTNGSSPYQPCDVSSASYTASSGAGPATLSPPSPTSIASGMQSQPSPISLPLPTPAGVPAGGIFKQMAARAANANLSVLYLDPVAVELSTSGSAPVSPSGIAGTSHGGQPSSLVAQSAKPALDFGYGKASFRSSSDSIPHVIQFKTAARPSRSRAELPGRHRFCSRHVSQTPGVRSRTRCQCASGDRFDDDADHDDAGIGCLGGVTYCDESHRSRRGRD